MQALGNLAILQFGYLAIRASCNSIENRNYTLVADNRCLRYEPTIPAARLIQRSGLVPCPNFPLT